MDLGGVGVSGVVMFPHGLAYIYNTVIGAVEKNTLYPSTWVPDFSIYYL